MLRYLTDKSQSFQLLDISLRNANPVHLVVRLKAPEEIVAQEHFPIVWGNTLSLYDLRTQRVSQQSLAVCFSDGTSYVDLDPALFSVSERTLLVLTSTHTCRQLSLASVRLSQCRSVRLALSAGTAVCTLSEELIVQVA